MLNKIPRKKNIKGFTLIELMISISILTLLLFTGSYTYSLLHSRWDKQLGGFDANVYMARNLELLQRILEGIHPFIVVDQKKVPSFFFIGAQNSLLAVSQSGMFSENFPEIFRLTSVQQSSGKFKLIYQAISTENILLRGTEQVINFQKKITLFENLDSVNFSYLGWRNYQEKSDRHNSGHKMIWSSAYSGINTQITPQKLTLTLTKEGEKLIIPIELDSNSERRLSHYIDSDS